MNWLLWSTGSRGEWFGMPYLASAAVACLGFAAFERAEVESPAPATLTPT